MKTIKVAELFAGVGGFRLALDGYKNEHYPEFNRSSAGSFQTVWANQWEPPGTPSKQFAFDCYIQRFGRKACVNKDIEEVLDDFEALLDDSSLTHNQKQKDTRWVPDVDMVVGGFPCQDYSVAKPLSASQGIEGKKGALWWSIYRFLNLKQPRFVLLENVDRLLKSPARERGRDFAILLACLAELGYSVEWHVVNSAEYGCNQRRKRVYIFAEKTDSIWNLSERLEKGVLAQALPILKPEQVSTFEIQHDPYDISEEFDLAGEKSPFKTAGVMQDFKVATFDLVEAGEGVTGKLGNVLIEQSNVPENFFISPSALKQWKYLKGSKSEERVNKKTGHVYRYSEGQMAFPDSVEKPSRTILTGEGGAGASRFKHIIEQEGRFRRLVPDELDALQGFPAGWTNTGMTDTQRAFCMGNALVVDIPHRIGKVIAKELVSAR